MSDSNGKKIAFSEASFKKISAILSSLNKKSNALLCIFADMNGYPISYSGNYSEDNIASLSALAAGDFAATSEMAKILNNQDDFKYLFHEGDQKNVYLCNVYKYYLLIVIFGKGTALGMVRLLANNAVIELTSLIEKINQEGEQASQFLDEKFRDLLSQELDKTFGKSSYY